MKIIRTYSELIALSTFEERYKYLKLDGVAFNDTFGFDRIFNQKFYKSIQWKQLRHRIIVRDKACDLAFEGRDLYNHIIIHHMNPITLYDITNITDYLMNPEYLVCVSHQTHNAIHYGDENQLLKDPIVRTMNDTCPWKIERKV